MSFYYLSYSLLFLILLSIALFLRRDLWKSAWPGMLLGAFIGPLSEIFYFYDYWRPRTIIGIAKVSLEDVIFGASIVGLSLTLYAFLTHRLIMPRSSAITKKQLGKSLILIILGIALLELLVFGLDLNSIFATILVAMLLWAVIVLRRRDLFVPTLVTGVVLCLIATLVYMAYLNLINPQLLNWWLLKDSWLGITVLGNVPLTELLWFFAIGCSLPALYLYTTHQRYQGVTRGEGVSSASS